jgi:uncharacterized delta-60 repeat protein
MNEASKNAPGDLDPVFGESGIKQIEQPHTTVFQAHGLALSGEGKLLIAGSHLDPSGDIEYFSLDRRTDQGDPDPTFGDGGFVDGRFTSDAGLSSLGVKAFALENTRVLLFGTFVDGTGSLLPGFAKFHTDGQSDTEFGDQGSCVVRSPLIPEFGRYKNAFLDACIQSTKHILTIHPHLVPTHLTTLILKTDKDGTVDNDFNEGKGYVDAEQSGSEQTWLRSIAVQTDDKILVCGYTEGIRGINTGIILRYQKDGQVDSSFGTTGAFRRQDWYFEHLVVVDDRILCCGSTASGEALLIELDVEGKIQGEPSITPANVSTRWTKMAWKGNKFILTGKTNDVFGGQFVVARINGDRTPDRSFGKGGFVSIDFGAPSTAPVDFILDDNQKILLLISINPSIGAQKFVLARLLT